LDFARFHAEQKVLVLAMKDEVRANLWQDVEQYWQAPVGDREHGLETVLLDKAAQSQLRPQRRGTLGCEQARDG
jgi:hypothetical protein